MYNVAWLIAADALIMIPLEIEFLGYLNFVFVSFGEIQRTGYPENPKRSGKIFEGSPAASRGPSFGPHPRPRPRLQVRWREH